MSEQHKSREIANFIWNSIANKILWNKIKKGKFSDVIFPFTVIRRMDCVLEPTHEKVLAAHEKYHKDLKNLDGVLTKASGAMFYNKSKFTLKILLDDAPSIKTNFDAYLNGFSPNVQEIIEKFKFRNTIDTLQEKEILYSLTKEFCKPDVDLSPASLSNHEMGYVFEELIRKYNESTDENPGEHFTPREIIKLMARMVIAKDHDHLKRRGAIVTLLDPCCGSGGMLTVGKEEICKVNPTAKVELFGQESVDETYAACKADMMVKGEDPDKIKPNSSFSHDGFIGKTFDYMLMNPPYGSDWTEDKVFINTEHDKGSSGRFGVGLPSIDDGSLLFLQHVISKMHKDRNKSRIGIVFNGSPLFNGDAGSGESEIRRWALENDWLEAIIGLPRDLFYNTGIYTYIWMLTNRKDEADRGKVKMIDAREYCRKMGKSLGDKRNEIAEEQISEIISMYTSDRQSEKIKFFKTTDFAYRKVRIERPLRLNYRASADKIKKLDEESGFINLAVSKKLKNQETKAQQESEGIELQKKIKKLLAGLPDKLYKNAADFERLLDSAFEKAGVKVLAPARKAILKALSEKDETAEIVKDAAGDPLPDSDLRDHEYIPYAEDIEKYFDREVKPYAADAWIDKGYVDEKDGKTGKIGYEINFNRYFYKYQPPRPLEEIEKNIATVEAEIKEMLWSK
ncbi:MAG: restriction endonuclease subunit M [Elusimicrobia bacterium RIFOXYA12_FULL_51_18]|nr:MAG: restriction endonuclease subunit M [Elusimicrobia bacterium RIFOXYA12_FULL_51_18]OGS29518.1 MAG: restriction endonuclease subunit M [Elusimicrobia bacterium RIFOXYA2_FULL_53_38]